MKNIFMATTICDTVTPHAETPPDNRGRCETGRLDPVIGSDQMHPCYNGWKCVEQMMKKMHSRKRSFNRRRPRESPDMIS